MTESRAYSCRRLTRFYRRASLVVALAILAPEHHRAIALQSPLPSSRRARKSSSLDVYVRLSPLIGGPRFLPLHVEVMLSDRLAPRDGTGNDAAGGDEKTSSPTTTTTTLTTSSVSQQLHRFDFVPENPTDPRTLGRLLTFQSVPGLARYRLFESSLSTPPSTAEKYLSDDEQQEGEGGSLDDTLSSMTELQTIASGSSRDRIIRGRNGWTFQLRSIDGSAEEMISSGIQFTRQFQAERGDLDLLRNSCFNYALQLLSHLSSHLDVVDEERSV